MSASLLGFCPARLSHSTSHCLSLTPYLPLSGNSIHKLVYSLIPLSHPFLPRSNHCLSFWCPFPSICTSLHHLPPPSLSFTPDNLLTVNNPARWSLFKWTDGDPCVRVNLCVASSESETEGANCMRKRIFVCTYKHTCSHAQTKYRHTQF